MKAKINTFFVRSEEGNIIDVVRTIVYTTEIAVSRNKREGKFFTRNHYFARAVKRSDRKLWKLKGTVSSARYIHHICANQNCEGC